MSMHLVHVLGSGPTEVQIDPGRVMEAIVGAIGFLGAAAIIQGRFELFGATTGREHRVVGAIGMACGFGFYGARRGGHRSRVLRAHRARHAHRDRAPRPR